MFCHTNHLWHTLTLRVQNYQYQTINTVRQFTAKKQCVYLFFRFQHKRTSLLRNERLDLVDTLCNEVLLLQQ